MLTESEKIKKKRTAEKTLNLSFLNFERYTKNKLVMSVGRSSAGMKSHLRTYESVPRVNHSTIINYDSSFTFRNQQELFKD